MTAGRLRSLLLALVVVAAAQIGFVAGCTDGTTPDCSDAATPCGPNVGDSAADGSDASDAKQDIDLPDTSVPDTGGDADLDAGDEV